MHIESFTPEEQKALYECVASIKALPIYDSPELEAIFCYSKADIEKVLQTFPDWDLYDEAIDFDDCSGDILRLAFGWLLNGSDKVKKAMYSRLSFDVSIIPYLYEKFDA